MNLKPENVTGNIELLESNYFEQVNGTFTPIYGILITDGNPITISISISLLNENKEVKANVRFKSTHTFKDKLQGKFTVEETEFLTKIALSNTNGKFIDFVFEDSNKTLLLTLESADIIYSNMVAENLISLN